MFKFNLLLTIRHLYRNRTYSLLNILGLTIGLSCAILLLTDIYYNLGYDRFHKNYHSLYNLNSFTKDNQYAFSQHSAQLGPMLKAQMAEVEDYTRISYLGSLVKTNTKSFIQTGLFVDDNFFSMFSFPLKAGNVNTVLKNSNSIVITEKMAEKFFQTTNCIGQTLLLKNGDDLDSYLVSGVVQEIPAQSTMKFDFVIPFSKLVGDNKDVMNFTANSNTTWLLLKNKVNIDQVNQTINKIIAANSTDKNRTFFLFPLKEKYLFNYFDGKRNFLGSIMDVVIFSSIALLILLVACSNFINLAIAFSLKRFGETGVKKVLGSTRKGIIFQFLGESTILTIISFALALVLVWAILPAFIAFSPVPKDLVIPFSNFKVMACIVGAVLLTGLLSGAYPALVLSAVKTSKILKSNVPVKGRVSIFRQGLIVFQFFIAIVFITMTIVVWRQSDFLNTKDLGLNKDNILYFENHENINAHQDAFKERLLAIPGISSVCFSNSKPFESVRNAAEVNWPGKSSNDNGAFQLINTDYDYAKTLNPKILKGRFFEKGYATDVQNFVINEMAAKTLKMDNPVGKTIKVNNQQGTIVGLVKDFHTASLFSPFDPVVIRIKPQETYCTIVQFVAGAEARGLTEKISQLYKQYESEYIAEINYSSEVFYRQNSRDKAAVLTGVFAAIAIVLSCLGLYGLTAFSAERRSKEIAIRKINGSSISAIHLLLLRSFMKWALIAVCLGVPIVLILSKVFLGIFAFRISLPVWAFVAGPLCVVGIAILSVSWLSYRAASRNPVESLRYE